MPLPEQHLQTALDSMIAAGAAGVLAQYRDGDQVWNGASGVARLDSPAPVDPMGSFRAGSITKTFTATVVLQLAKEGVLDLADSVERWLPGTVPDGDKITLLRLLNHTSGLYNYTNDLPDYAGLVRERFLHREPAEAISTATSHEPLFSPGDGWSYSNTNYILLGLVIEAATGNTYAGEVDKRILSRLGLRQTYVSGDDTTMPEPHAHGYLPVDGELVDMAELNATQAWAAGALVSTAADLNRFYAALLTGELVDPRELQTTVPTDADNHQYGLGISRLSLPGLEVWGHSGGIHGYATWSYHSADAARQLTVSLTTAEVDRPETYDVLVSLLSL
jgi:D-alanyl-D-alanine carboxypeptidase